jgi:hypothetical protein
MKKELIKSLKEGARVFLMAIIPLIVIDIQAGIFDWKKWAIAGVIAILRFIDKLLHETGIAEQ